MLGFTPYKRGLINLCCLFLIVCLNGCLSPTIDFEQQNQDIDSGHSVSQGGIEGGMSDLCEEGVKQECECVYGDPKSLTPVDADPKKGAFFPNTLLQCRKPAEASAVHEVEAFGPVSTVIGYSDLDEAIEFSRRGGGSLWP